VYQTSLTHLLKSERAIQRVRFFFCATILSSVLRGVCHVLMNPVSTKLVSELLLWFAGPEADGAANSHPFVISCSERVHTLLVRDYDVVTIDNADGSLCASYPPKLWIMMNRGGHQQNNWTSSNFKGHFERCRLARARTRFVMPVLLVSGRYICRSATLR
jgi:hypothetical protein